MEKEYINEAAWSKIFPILRECKDIYTRNEARCKNFMEAIFWMARTGAQWREMHERYGKWNTIYSRFNAWSKKSIWEKLLVACATDPDLEYIMIDATIVRAHACAAGYGNQAEQALGRSKGGFTSKIHAKVDALGNPLKILLTPGQRNDVTQAKSLLEGQSGDFTIADKGYDSDEVREVIKSNDSESVIPPRENRNTKYDYDKDIYKERHVIECFFGKIKHFRRIFSRFDKSARNFAAFLSFVGAMIWLR